MLLSRQYGIACCSYNSLRPFLRGVCCCASHEQLGNQSVCDSQISSVVSAMHFRYPGDAKNPNGKLRLLYECAPMSFLVEQVGLLGKAPLHPQLLSLSATKTHPLHTSLINEVRQKLELKLELIGIA